MNLLISLHRTAPLRCLFLDLSSLLAVGNLRERQSQVGSLAGAAHLLNNNTGVLRSAQLERKSSVDDKAKS